MGDSVAVPLCKGAEEGIVRTVVGVLDAGESVTTFANDGSAGRGFVLGTKVTAGFEAGTLEVTGAGGTFHFSANRGGTTRSFRALVAAT